jgi:hypothetical protein
MFLVKTLLRIVQSEIVGVNLFMSTPYHSDSNLIIYVIIIKLILPIYIFTLE